MRSLSAVLAEETKRKGHIEGKKKKPEVIPSGMAHRKQSTKKRSEVSGPFTIGTNLKRGKIYVDLD